MKKLDWEKFKNKFHPSWWKIMQPIIESEEVFEIFQKLKTSGEDILPKSDALFNSFKFSNYDKIKAIIVLSDPYPWVINDVIVADGIPMSCSNTNVLQPSLEQFYSGMDREFSDTVERNPNLSYLLDEGCLLINASLTVKRGVVASHRELWYPFYKQLLKHIKPDVIYWFMGVNAKALEGFIGFNKRYFTEHPAAAAHKETDWDSKGVFTKINEDLIELGKDPITWDYSKYLPF